MKNDKIILIKNLLSLDFIGVYEFFRATKYSFFSIVDKHDFKASQSAC